MDSLRVGMPLAYPPVEYEPRLGTLSAPVSLSRSRKCCCLPRVSHSRLHPPAHPVPTRRLPWHGSPAFHRYHECATTSDNPWLALRLSLRACCPVDRFVRSAASNGRLASAGSCSAGVNPSGIRSGRLSDLPSSHETLAPAPPLRDRLTPMPCSQTPAEPPALILSRARHRPQTLERQGLRQCGQFRGSIARLGARCATVSRVGRGNGASRGTLRASVTADDATLASGG